MSAARACGTCKHFRRDGTWSDPDRCDAFHARAFMMRSEPDYCGLDGRFWEPRPPRRSVARWLYDTFLNMGSQS